jgi:hypothetical protein
MRENRGTVSDRRPYLVTPAARKSAVAARKQLELFPHESEDARLTGATRSLYRRLLALNLPSQEISRIEATSRHSRELKETRVSLSGMRTA